MPVSANDILNATSPIGISPNSMLSYYEARIKETEFILADFKRKASFLKRKMKNNDTVEINEFNMKLTNIKWRSEIRSCITPENPKEQFYIATSTQIASCIAYRNDLEIINRDIKSKISSTLSSMFKEGEIGRFGGDFGKDYLYGIKEFFNSDSVTISPKYAKQFEVFMKTKEAA